MLKNDQSSIKLRRSVLFMPSINVRATAKATQLPADVIILDLEDSVLPTEKHNAREALAQACRDNDYGHREVLVRINGLSTPEWRDDLAVCAACNVSGIVVPKIESAQGIINALEIATSASDVTALIVGTADLSKAMQLSERADRLGLQHALSQVVLAARVANITVIDGVYMDVQDQQGLEIECEQGRALGFDGKSLIHPNQLIAANQYFAPSAKEIKHARQLLDAWEQSREQQTGVCVMNNKLVEYLHVEQARELLAVADAIEPTN